MILTFLGVASLFCTASILNTFWTKQVVENKAFQSGVTAGLIRCCLLVGMWLAFVNESYGAALGMVAGETIGSWIGVHIYNRRRRRELKRMALNRKSNN